MAPQTPLLFYDNVFDTVQMYPSGAVAASNQRVGHEAYRVASYRRERQSWQASVAMASNYVYSDLGVAVTRAVDMLFIDRGHNLWGKTVRLQGDDGLGGSTTGPADAVVPALGTLGGDPTAGWCVTEEGAIWRLFAQTAARRRWLVYVLENWAPVIPGIICGQRLQLLGFSTVFDEDASGRTESFSTSTAGYRGYDTTYAWRTLELGLAFINATEYDSAIRAARATIFAKNQPFFGCFDWGTRPERAWLYQWDGTTWAMPKKRVYRGGVIRARELGASLG